jgi:paraquat-inducible protein B
MTLDYDAVQHRFPTVVGIQIYPQRLGRVLKKLQKPDADPQDRIVRFLNDMVAHGMRARVRSANLLTGQLYVSIEYVPDAPAAAFDESARPLTLPTAGGNLDRMEEQLASIVGKIDRMPLETIGKNLDAALADLDKTIRRLDGTLGRFDEQVLPEAVQTLQRARQTLGAAEGTLSAAEGALAEDAPLQHNLVQTLLEVQRAARSLRVLADLLGRNPESLLRGRPTDPPGLPDESPTPGQEPQR